MKELFKKLEINHIYIISITVISSLIFCIFSLRYKKIINTKDPGFRDANVVNDDENNCIGGSDNIQCELRLVKNLNAGKKNILFFGNSQTGAINQYRSGDINYVSLLNNKFSSNNKKISIKSIWLPNANMKEFDFIYNSLRKCTKNIDVIFIPFFLDDTRNATIRKELNFFEENICKKESIKKTKESKYTGNVRNLDKKIKNNFIFIEKLEGINQNLKIDIYKFRNFIFNIKPSTIRPIKKPSYEANLIAFRKILKFRNKENLKTYVYIPPLLNSNGNGEIPYSKYKYENFKKEVENICLNNNCKYFNLEDLIPNKFWGLKQSTSLGVNKKELDFMHFTGTGHKILSEKFNEIIRKQIEI